MCGVQQVSRWASSSVFDRVAAEAFSKVSGARQAGRQPEASDRSGAYRAVAERGVCSPDPLRHRACRYTASGFAPFAGDEPKTVFCLSAGRERGELLSPEKHSVSNALHGQLDTQGLRRRAQSSPYSSRRFSLVWRQPAGQPGADPLDITLVLPEPEEGRTNGRLPVAGLFPRHSTESWHERPPEKKSCGLCLPDGKEYNHEGRGRKEGRAL